MTSTARDFCFWLQGVLSVNQTVAINDDQAAAIKSNLQFVFENELAPPTSKGKKSLAQTEKSVA